MLKMELYLNTPKSLILSHLQKTVKYVEENYPKT